MASDPAPESEIRQVEAEVEDDQRLTLTQKIEVELLTAMVLRLADRVEQLEHQQRTLNAQVHRYREHFTAIDQWMERTEARLTGRKRNDPALIEAIDTEATT
jgi:hypothetical protein